MDALMLAIILTLLLDQGSGTQRVVARFASRCASQAEPSTEIVIGLGMVIAANAGIAAAFGAVLAAWLMPDARLLFLAMALVIGGFGLLWSALPLAAGKPGKEIGGVRTLLSFALRRAGENAAFCTAGIATFTDAPLFTATGAILGGWAALILPLCAGETAVHHGAFRAVRAIAGLALLSIGIACAVNALHLV